MNQYKGPRLKNHGKEMRESESTCIFVASSGVHESALI